MYKTGGQDHGLWAGAQLPARSIKEYFGLNAREAREKFHFQYRLIKIVTFLDFIQHEYTKFSSECQSGGRPW
jgi:hypothetical protein